MSLAKTELKDKSRIFWKISAVTLISCGIGFSLWIVFVFLQKPSGKTVEIPERTRQSKQIAEKSKQKVAAPSEVGQKAEPELAQESNSGEMADEEDRLVDEFDNLTDKWMKPSKKEISQNDVSAFVASFKRVPKSRRSECIHRALNLIPDENVLLLAGIVFDKSLGKETIEVVFSDILNRDEEMKKMIMKEIFKDKSHPCWADVAWILDVTGELPGKGGK